MKSEYTQRTIRQLACSAAAFMAAVVGMFLMTGTPAQAAEPSMYLVLQRSAALNAARNDCVRGELFLVRSFSDADIQRGVRIGDTLEVLRTAKGLTTSKLSDGMYTTKIEASKKDDWYLALATGTTQLKAHKHGEIKEPGIFLGRRTGKQEGNCNLSNNRLEDGEVITRRLRRLIDWQESKQPIEILLRTSKTP